jgi:hypothetical protein
VRSPGASQFQAQKTDTNNSPIQPWIGQQPFRPGAAASFSGGLISSRDMIEKPSRRGNHAIG